MFERVQAQYLESMSKFAMIDGLFENSVL